MAIGTWRTTTSAVQFSPPPASRKPSPSKFSDTSRPWKTVEQERGAAVQTERSANSPTLVYIVKKFLFTTYSWESGKGPHGPGLALTWVLLQIFHPSNPRAEKSNLGWWQTAEGCRGLCLRCGLLHPKCMGNMQSTLWLSFYSMSLYIETLCSRCSRKTGHFSPIAMASTLPTQHTYTYLSLNNTDINHLKNAMLSLCI